MNTRRWQFWAGLTAFSLVLAALVGGTIWLYQLVTDEQEVPLAHLVLQGDRELTRTEDIRAALLAEQTGSFFTADVDELRRRVEALPWIYSVSVRKEWPQRLRVYVVEQEPAAIWNEERLVNTQGQLFTAPLAEAPAALPRLRGPEGSKEEVLHQYHRVRSLLELAAMEVAQLELTERFAVTLWLRNGIELRLGREARLQRVQRFIELYPVIKEAEERAVAYVDLRYDTGIAVGWAE